MKKKTSTGPAFFLRLVKWIRCYIRFFMFADTLEQRCFSFKAVFFHLLEEFETKVNFISSIYGYSATMKYYNQLYMYLCRQVSIKSCDNRR